MYDNYHYPAGADNEMAPWNEESIPEEDFEVTCSQTLSKTVTVTTDNYIPGASGVDYEPDGDGGYCASGWHDDPDTSETDWAKEYHDCDYHTPGQLLLLFKDCLLQMRKNGEVFRTLYLTNKLIEECEGWTEDETEYIEE